MEAKRTSIIPLKIESQNEIDRWKHMKQRWRIKKMKNDWGLMIRSSFGKMKGLAPYTHVLIHSFRIKKLDYDNLVAGCKHAILDNLRDLGYIEDDSPDKVTVTYEQSVVNKHTEGTLISLWTEPCGQ